MFQYLTTPYQRTPNQFLTFIGFETSDSFLKDTPDFDTLRILLKN